MRKRILSLLLALVLLLGLLPATALTARAAKAWDNEITNLNKLEAELVAAIRAGRTNLGVSNYKLTPDDLQMNRLKEYSPYISNGIDIDCRVDSYSGIYTKIDITCPMSKTEVNAYFDEVKAKVAEVDALLAAVPSDADKVLVLHDYLAYNGEYDRSETVPQDSFNTAGLVLGGRGVCQAYTYAMMYFLNRAGIECHCVESVLMNHTWNVVRIGGSYYHVDSTWDDPAPDVLGMVGHKFLLLSDDAVSAVRAIGANKPHYGYALPVSCDSAEYDRAYWYGVDSPVVIDGNYRYFCKDGRIIKRDVKSGSETVLQQIVEWDVWGDEDAYYDGEFYTGLRLEGGKLYYNTSTEIRCLDVNTGKDEAVFAADTSNGFIYGSVVIDGVMYYDIRQEKKDKGVRHFFPLAEMKLEDGHVHSYKEIKVAPTCTEDGCTLHACACGDSWAENYVKATGHAWDAGKITTQPTDKATGVKTFTCTRCGLTRTETVPTTTHTHSYTAVVTAPTCTEKGYTTHTCACGDSYKDSEVKALGHDFKNGVCTRCGAKQQATQPSASFNDVTRSAWFYEAVNYAVSNGLMNGVGNGRFAPDDPMTRSMLVTVLWRYEGEPNEGANGFTDVPAGQWYTDAVAWAASKGIVGGVGGGRFDPNGNITREQMAAILFRYAQGKGFDTTQRGNLGAFSDQGKVSSYAVDAIAWTVAEGIIGGSDGKLDPQGNATRAQVSTILMRFIENIAKK